MTDYSVSDLARSGIYQIVNTTNGKRYVGSAVRIDKRWAEHRQGLKRGSHHSRYLQASWLKHGERVFSFGILEFCDVEALLTREQHYFDTLHPEFNICKVAGSTLGRFHGPETRAKIAAKATGRKAPPRSAEHRAKISIAHKGRAKSADHLAALQAGRSKQVFTEERKAKIGASLRAAYESGLKNRERPPEYRSKIGRALAKLTDEQVREIRRLLSEGQTGVTVAKAYSVNTGTISEIRNRKSYQWVE
jgi:group I intron endonuclease